MTEMMLGVRSDGYKVCLKMNVRVSVRTGANWAIFCH